MTNLFSRPPQALSPPCISWVLHEVKFSLVFFSIVARVVISASPPSQIWEKHFSSSAKILCYLVLFVPDPSMIPKNRWLSDASFLPENSSIITGPYLLEPQASDPSMFFETCFFAAPALLLAPEFSSQSLLEVVWTENRYFLMVAVSQKARFHRVHRSHVNFNSYVS